MDEYDGSCRARDGSRRVRGRGHRQDLFPRNLRRGIKRGSKITSDLENFLDRSSWQAFGAGAKLDNVAQSWLDDALQSSDMTGWQ